MIKPPDKKCGISWAATEKVILGLLPNYQQRALQALANIEALLDLQFDLIEILDSHALHSIDLTLNW